jgi:hypothetical protein
MYIKITCSYYHVQLCARNIESFIGPFDKAAAEESKARFEESLAPLQIIHTVEIVSDATSWERCPPTTSPIEFAIKMQQEITSKQNERFI